MAEVLIGFGVLAFVWWGFPGNKKVYSAPCGSGVIQLSIVKKTENVMVGKMTFAELTYEAAGSVRSIQRYSGPDLPRGVRILNGFPHSEGVTSKSIASWNVVIRGADFEKDEQTMISSYLSEHAAEINKVLAKRNVDGVSGMQGSGAVLQIVSVSILDSVYSPAEAKSVQFSGPYREANPYEFLGADGEYLRISTDNLVVHFKTTGASKIGFVDVPTRTFHFETKGRSKESVEQSLAVLNSAKNQKGQALPDLFKVQRDE